MTMPTETKPTALLRVRCDVNHVPMVTSFVENGALLYGLAQAQATELTLAAEEIFTYLCQASRADHSVEISCLGGGYYVRADFRFAVKHFNMRAFNLTATVSLSDAAGMQEMGLLIASRFVDRLNFKETDGGGVQLALIKEKIYPQAVRPPDIRAAHLETYAVRAPNSEELKCFAQLIAGHYPAGTVPAMFQFPGKVADMAASGEYRAALSMGDGGRIGGGIFWQSAGAKTVECYGPYLFNQQKGSLMARELLEACIGDIARSQTVGLINRYPTADLPVEHFEPLGSWTMNAADGAPVSLTAYFRLMHEDPGASVWTHADLEGFLREEYRRLVLPREILAVTDQGETQNPFSVLTTEFDRFLGQVTLRPLCSGADIEKNLLSHIQLVTAEPGKAVFFLMDLAHPWQSGFTPFLLRHGFAPRAILPYAGDGDIVLFQLGRPSS